MKTKNHDFKILNHHVLGYHCVISTNFSNQQQWGGDFSRQCVNFKKIWGHWAASTSPAGHFGHEKKQPSIEMLGAFFAGVNSHFLLADVCQLKLAAPDRSRCFGLLGLKIYPQYSMIFNTNHRKFQHRWIPNMVGVFFLKHVSMASKIWRILRGVNPDVIKGNMLHRVFSHPLTPVHQDVACLPQVQQGDQ